MEWEPGDRIPRHGVVDAPRTYLYGMGTDLGNPIEDPVRSREPTFMEWEREPRLWYHP